MYQKLLLTMPTITEPKMKSLVRAKMYEDGTRNKATSSKPEVPLGVEGTLRH